MVTYVVIMSIMTALPPQTLQTDVHVVPGDLIDVSVYYLHMYPNGKMYTAEQTHYTAGVSGRVNIMYTGNPVAYRVTVNSKVKAVIGTLPDLISMIDFEGGKVK